MGKTSHVADSKNLWKKCPVQNSTKDGLFKREKSRAFLSMDLKADFNPLSLDACHWAVSYCVPSRAACNIRPACKRKPPLHPYVSSRCFVQRGVRMYPTVKPHCEMLFASGRFLWKLCWRLTTVGKKKVPASKPAKTLSWRNQLLPRDTRYSCSIFPRERVVSYIDLNLK